MDETESLQAAAELYNALAEFKEATARWRKDCLKALDSISIEEAREIAKKNITPWVDNSADLIMQGVDSSMQKILSTLTKELK
jgi:hypothetical protein